MRRLIWVLSVPIMLAMALLGYALAEARRDPIVRTTDVALPGLPADATPLSIVLISDIHVAGPDMPVARLTRIVGQINALRPDLVLIAGDLISGKLLATRHYTMAEAIAPLGGLRARLGVIAVLGNHDHLYDGRRGAQQARRALQAAGIVELDNRAVQVGPIRIMGLDDMATRHMDVAQARRSLVGGHGPIVALEHVPDAFMSVPEAALVLAGHSHCGQVRWPRSGPPRSIRRFGHFYACGRMDNGARTLIVGAGLGTSNLPIRFGAAPDFWRITLHAPR